MQLKLKLVLLLLSDCSNIFHSLKGSIVIKIRLTKQHIIQTDFSQATTKGLFLPEGNLEFGLFSVLFFYFLQSSPD